MKRYNIWLIFGVLMLLLITWGCSDRHGNPTNPATSLTDDEMGSAAAKAKEYHTVTIVVDGDGKALPNKDEIKVPDGGRRRFVFIPKRGNGIEDVTLLDGSVLDDVRILPSGLGLYWLKDITDDDTLTVTFSKSATTGKFTITTEFVRKEGRIWPRKAVVPKGASRLFKILPARGYEIDDVTLDDDSILDDVTIKKNGRGFYKLRNVKEDHVIEATFVEKS